MQRCGACLLLFDDQPQDELRVDERLIPKKFDWLTSQLFLSRTKEFNKSKFFSRTAFRRGSSSPKEPHGGDGVSF